MNSIQSKSSHKSSVIEVMPPMGSPRVTRLYKYSITILTYTLEVRMKISTEANHKKSYSF